jgi:hypothetical protein
MDFTVLFRDGDHVGKGVVAAFSFTKGECRAARRICDTNFRCGRIVPSIWAIFSQPDKSCLLRSVAHRIGGV